MLYYDVHVILNWIQLIMQECVRADFQQTAHSKAEGEVTYSLKDIFFNLRVIPRSNILPPSGGIEEQLERN